MTDAIDILNLFAKRASIVHQIADGGASKRALTMTLPLSRSTIVRAIQDLTMAQLIQKDGDEYEFTLHGWIAYREFRRVIDHYSGLTAATPLLHHLPPTTMLPGIIFNDVTVIRPTPPASDAPRTRFVDRVRRSEEIVGTGTVVSQRLVEVFHNQLTSHGLKLMLFLNEQVVEHLWDAHHDTLCTALKIDHCTLQSVEQMPPFSLVIVDWTDIWLGIYNACGQLQGILHTESSAAVEWAEQRLQQYAERSTPVCYREQSLEQRSDGST
jgi:predicted transcriptional regulator